MNKTIQTLVLLSFLGKRTLNHSVNVLLCVCILFCSAVAVSLSLFGKSVQSSLAEDIGDFLGAPLVVRSAKSISEQSINIHGLNRPVITRTLTTGAFTNDIFQSVSLKGISGEYPLQGELIVKFDEDEKSTNGKHLSTNIAWLDTHALNELKIDLGDTIQIGEAILTVGGELMFEPDRLTQAQHTLPRVIVSLETLKKTGVLISNERVDHRYLFSGSQEALDKLEKDLPSFTEHNYQILKPTLGNHPFSRISLRAQRMSDLVLLLLLLMCGAAVTMLADHFVQRYTHSTAVLRCMGLSRRVVVAALSLQLLILSVCSSVLGFFLAWLVHPFLLGFMEPYMSLTEANVGLSDLTAPMIIGIVMVVTFIFPSLYRLTSITVVKVLRGNVVEKKGVYVKVIFATVLIITMLWYSSDNAQLTAMLVTAVGFLVLLSITFGWILTKVSAQCHRFFSGPIKIAIRSIGRSPRRHITPLVSIAITMMAVLMTVTLKGSFINNLQVQRLEADGNYIFTGLPDHKKIFFIKALQKTGIDLKGLYPSLSAKLVTINGQSLDKALKKESDTRGQLRSKVRLSWAETMPKNNTLLKGEWPRKAADGVSVEDEVMEDLGLSLGDELGFQIGDDIVTSSITSVRKYKTAESSMMFWFMFSPDALQKFDYHYMGGFLLKNDLFEDKVSLKLKKLSEKFPQLRIIELERQIEKIRNVFYALTRIMNSILILLLSAAALLVISSSLVGSAQQIKQLSLLHAFGLQKQQTYIMNIVQQVTVGLVACVVGILGTQVVAGFIFKKVFNLTYTQEWLLVGIIILCVTFTSAFLACLFTFRRLRHPIRLSL